MLKVNVPGDKSCDQRVTSVCVRAWVLSHVWLFVTPWTVAHQGPLFMKFSRQEYWNGLPFPSPEDLSNPGTEPVCLASPELAGMFFTSWATWEAPHRRVLSPKTHNPSLTRGKKQRNPNQGTVFLLSEQYSSELSRSSKRREVWDTVRLESSKETWVLMQCGVLDGSWDRKWASMDKLVKSE